MVRSSRERGYALLVVVAVLAAAGGTLLILNLLKPDPAKIKQRCIRELKDLQARAGLDPEILEAGFDSLLADEEYPKHAADIRRQVEKMKLTVHRAAIAQKEARADCVPYLARTQNVAAIPESELARLCDEGEALLARHAGTRPAEPVEVRVRELQARLAAKNAKRVEPLDLLRLQTESLGDLRNSRFAAARDRVDAFERAHEVDAESGARLRGLRETIEKAAAAEAESVLSKAREHAAAGRKADALRLLDAALPNLAGFPQAGLLEALARELR